MFPARWFRRKPVPLAARPTLQILEDRTVPSGFGGFFKFLSPPSGPATHLVVTVPENVTSGKAFEVQVEAEDASNRRATSYTGTVSLSLGTADPGATVPTAPYTFSATTDHGIHDFMVTLAATGSQTITAKDTADSFTDSAATFVIPAPVATTLVVETQETAAVGVASPVTVEVLDQSGNLLRNFTGTVTLTSSDLSATAKTSRKATAASVPITYTFTTKDHGEHTFDVTFNETAATTGTVTTVTASTTTPSLTDSGSVTVYPPTVVTHFGVITSSYPVSGKAAAVEVEALNAANQVVTGYAGTVTLTSSDMTATASATKGGTATLLSSTFTYMFGTGDAGKHTFYVTFGTTGPQTLTVTDAGPPVLTGTADVDVFVTPPFRKRYFF